MPSLISHLNQSERRELLENLNYLNMDEIKTWCRRHSIPYAIWIETSNGRRKTPEHDRKGVILNRVRHYLETGKILNATCFPATVVYLDKPSENIKVTDRLFYGQYDKKSAAMVSLLEGLTDGHFKDGAIARILATEFWSKGIAPTYQEYAKAWVAAKEHHQRPNPEWAFLSDRSDRKDVANWKKLRASKARQVLKILNQLAD